ncbi:hypothetical protein C2845_PM09G19770 [Panicum miliaceum]|uniref:Proliferating cell nuclear antigen PCNA C-terminal domain-containing protein n=1 Tax=Panicum miliaceum TaxID=4540 RepID=A0A3L6S2L3_PANMI|nr:hypothetical protein C2845_PM09G19770 [Panicum miliaceum]
MVHRFYLVIYKANCYWLMEDLVLYNHFHHISVTEKGLKFLASGISGRVNIKYMQPEEATAIVVTMRAPVSVTLDLKYMNSSAKASTLFNQVKICLSTTQPLMVECKIGRMGYIRYFLAPKVKPEIKEEEIKGSAEKEIKKKERERDQRGTTKTKGVERKRKGAKRSKGAERTRKGSKRSKMKGSKRERERDRRGKGGDPKRKQRANRMKRRLKTSGGKQKRCGCQVLVFN